MRDGVCDMSNEWARITKFENLDFPCWLCAIETKQVHFWRTFLDMKANEPMYDLYTHWIPATPDTFPEPPKEPTQEEKDAELIKQVEEAYAKNNALYGRDMLIALAIDFERSEIRQLLKRHQCGELAAPEVIREISRRVKL